MKIKNSTEWPDYMLRRLASWCCKQSDLPVRQLRIAEFRNKSEYYSGHAYRKMMRIVCSVGRLGFPMEPDQRDGMSNEIIADRIEALVAITAHEVEHIAQYHTNRIRVLKSHRRLEPVTRRHEIRVLRLFRTQREELLAKWNVAPRARANVS